MIHIAICDDDMKVAQQIEMMIMNTQNNFSEQIEVHIFYSGESFARAVEKGCPFDIICMDIEMEGMDGITAGHTLRANDENDVVQLIYISSHEEYHLQLFDVQPSGFIKKPIEEDNFNNKLIPSIHKAIRKRQQGKINFLPVHQKGKEVLVPFRDIIFLESHIRQVIVNTREDRIEYYGTLNEEGNKLPSHDFIRIHQSYIVNFYFIKEIRSRKIVLTTGKELPISEKNSASVRMHYLKFRGDLIGT
ncbi:LytR/AlgR family response regulator transcription factor [Paenibacillus segetis]|uniref:DNA-binding response regulator n=1 Tax=Paenibacillus segetis TaxID=1325360 RepID=A0ABQ1Y7Z1_9BACL|nr:LytTR family DNA-binding domain-containing protein [Paenibacillus segetis]GGH15604.1 DNA-binding response regulator [Paenibacillus segetis]